MGGPDAWTARGTPETLAYATLEGIAFALRELAGDDTDGSITVLGGGSRLSPWVQLLADVFNRPLLLGGRDGIDGAAVLAGVSLEPTREPRVVFQPDADRHRLLDSRFRQWQAAFDPVTAEPMAASA
jgi:sugar (pentulose or hexulose) kinase